MRAPSPTGCLGIDVGGTKVALRIEAAQAGTAQARTAQARTAQAGAAQAGTNPMGGDEQIGPSRPSGPEGPVRPVETTFQWSPSATATQDIDDLAAHVAALTARWGGRVDAVGVAMPATIDAAGRVTTWPGRPAWTGLDLGAALRDLLPGSTVVCGDDGDLAALAEADAAGCENVVYLGVGTGVGGGIVLGGRSCPGPGRGSSEIGHLIISSDGPSCDCGRRGCVQATASGPATLRRATQRRGAEVTFAELRAAWLAADAWAVRTVGESAAAIATAVIGLTELLHPAMAVVGGGFAAGLPGFPRAVAEHAQTLARPGHPPAPVRPALLGGLSSLFGALLAAQSPARIGRLA
ncbi:ROK family protein [Frankia sp. B2]|uniref:ROK family protein n=1 Tax=unclassified Frankia TaxID=2632575 RepID=UPI0003D03825|nr:MULTISPECIES: ROK family protein [unclassified Frankia]ETA04475.1 transcriptional regulator/sugar kinase [Frankia sp. CcI6]KDA42465.1 transcriptional regulator/sugar kinase [Frankia sp. BMG5.23]KEZ38027.1 transcriptional regulator/sugar kinase [Frankia sp. CeD]KFB06479.1 transcriptional regulator/sugar kinase [Frankia sp. Allo2]OHV50873.1 kanamycin kinase [Frankia sp. CgIS1]